MPTVEPFENLGEVNPGNLITFLGDQKIVGWYCITRVDDPIDGLGVYGIFQSIWCTDTPEHDHPEVLVAEYGKPLPNRAPAKLTF